MLKEFDANIVITSGTCSIIRQTSSSPSPSVILNNKSNNTCSLITSTLLPVSIIIESSETALWKLEEKESNLGKEI